MDTMELTSAERRLLSLVSFLMDRISELHEPLLLRILSLLPAKDVVATMVLSKRWQFLWMFVPKLVYNDSYSYGRFSRFVDRSLLLREASTLKTVHFILRRQKYSVEDIGVWTRIAVKSCVRELIIEIVNKSRPTPHILPKSLYKGCQILVKLKLDNAILQEISSPVSFPSLKTLTLLSVIYPGDEFVKRFLSNCHVLEDLHVEQCQGDNVTIFTVIVHSLKNIILHTSVNRVANDDHGFVIDAPSLEHLDIVDPNGGFCVVENNMPKIETANVDVSYILPGNILGSTISAKRLSLCLSVSKDLYPAGTVFHRLVHLTLCTCKTEWLNLLMSMLKGFPKLRALKLEMRHQIHSDRLSPCWSEPSSVPECVISNLEILEWVGYEGAEEEKEVAAFILRSGSCLKKVTISSNSTDPIKKLEMIKELSSSPRCSPTCRLIFD